MSVSVAKAREENCIKSNCFKKGLKKIVVIGAESMLTYSIQYQTC